MLLFTEGVRTKGEVFSNILFIILLTVLGLLCALTKKVNTYVVLFSLLAMFVFVRNKRIWLIIPILTISVGRYEGIVPEQHQCLLQYLPGKGSKEK